MSVPTRQEGPRGCGYRQPGGLYLVSNGLADACPKLPIELRRCPTCGGGIKPSRGWTWLDEPDALLEPEIHGDAMHAALCPLSEPFEARVGLLWIGGKFYTPGEFTAEAARIGVSRRIPAVPRDLALGETWVLLAHREAASEVCGECADRRPDDECPECEGIGRVPVPAIFHLFKPTAIEYIVKGDESDDDLDTLRKRGISPIRVERVERQTSITEEV